MPRGSRRGPRLPLLGTSRATPLATCTVQHVCDEGRRVRAVGAVPVGPPSGWALRLEGPGCTAELEIVITIVVVVFFVGRRILETGGRRRTQGKQSVDQFKRANVQTHQFFLSSSTEGLFISRSRW